MTEVAAPVYLNPATQADALADALKALGFGAEVFKWRDYLLHPCVVIRCGARHVKQVEYVFAAPEVGGDDDTWWWWRVSPDDPLVMERILPVSLISATADLLARTLPQIQETNNGALVLDEPGAGSGVRHAPR
jgi:hypothetical protein